MNSASGSFCIARGTRFFGDRRRAAIAHQPREDQHLAGGVLARQIFARIRLGVALFDGFTHRLVKTACPDDTAETTYINVPLTVPSIRSTRSPVSTSF